MSYDHWKLRAPEDEHPDGFSDWEPELITCPRCERIFVDGHGGRIGTEYVCSPCYDADPIIAAELAAQHRADERRDDDRCPR